MSDIENKLNIAIIGAGWFGCHIASELLNEKNKYNVHLFEKENDIFLGASGNNQNRLHLGYHYPRSYITRVQSKKCFKEFVKKYPNFSNKISNNIYAIADDSNNITDFETYIQILKATGLKYKIIKPNKFGLKNIVGAIKTDERKINTLDVKKFFKKKLKKNLFLNRKIKVIKRIKNYFLIKKKKYDYVINCTWQQSFGNKKWNLHYEPCISLTYKIKRKHPAITIMDGPFITIYPWEKNEFNAYSVKNSRITSTKNINKANKILKQFSIKEKYSRKKTIEKEIIKFYPNFKKFFMFKKFSMCIRTIIKTKFHSRECKLDENRRFISILSGKVDHIFYATRKIKECLKKS